ncbi:MAG: hypothetical protein WC149_00950 [Arcobacteraceae bacterium]
MTKSDLKILLDICKSKIDKGASFEDIKNFVVTSQNEEIFLILRNDIESYLFLKEKYNLPNILLQPTGASTKEDFEIENYTSWAEKEVYENIWEKCVGDTVLFVKNNKIFAIAVIEDIKEDTVSFPEYPLRYYWNDSIKYVDIPLGEFNKIINYEENFTPRKFMRIPRESIKKAFEFLKQFN